MTPPRCLAIVVTCCLLVGAAGLASPAAAQDGTTLVVDGEDDGDGAYATIQAAVTAADDGDRIAVRPGTYAETVVLDANVTLLAPDGATFDGSALGDEAAAVTIPTDGAATPVVAGVHVTGYHVAVDGRDTSGDWTVRNVTVRNATGGVVAGGSTGDWRVSQLRVVESRIGVDAADATGAWTVRNATVRGGDAGLKAQRTSGDWTIRDASFEGAEVGVSAPESTGAWTIRGATIDDSGTVGLSARATEGAWALRESVVRDGDGAGVYAPTTTGTWTIRGSIVAGNDVDGTGDASAVDATNGEEDGDATRNWWGGSGGIDGDDCRGALTCADPLDEAPTDAGGDGYDGGPTAGPSTETSPTDWPVGPAEWPTFGSDATNAGLAAGEGVRAPIEQRWATLGGRAVASSPTIANGTAYVGSNDGYVYALDVDDGSVEWRFRTGDFVQSGPTVANGTVVVGSHDGDVYALDAASGAMEWEFETGAAVRASPTVANGTVFVGSEDDVVYALDLATGEVAWTFAAAEDVDVTAAVTDGTVYVGSDDERVYALDAETGAREWTIGTGAPIQSAPAVVGGTVYVGTLDGTALALAADTGAVEWQTTLAGQIRASPAVANETVYLGSTADEVIALDAGDGTERWRFETAMTPAAPVVDGESVYVGTAARRVRALDAENGTERWRTRTAGRVFSGPALAAGRLYVPSDGLASFASARDPPAIDGFSASAPAAETLRVVVRTSDSLATVDVAVRNGSGTTARLDRSAFERTGDAYAATVDVPGGSERTAVLRTAAGPNGSDGADGQRATATVPAANESLTVDAGANRTVTEGERVALNATTATGAAVTYEWVTGGNGTLTDASTATPTYEAPAVDEERVETVTVEVADGNRTATDRVHLTVEPGESDRTVAIVPADGRTVVDATRRFDLVLRRAGSPVGRYDLTVTVENGDVAALTGVTQAGPPATRTVEVGPDNETLSVAATRESGAVPLPQIRLRGSGRGATSVGVSVEHLAAPDGTPVPVDGVENATVHVTRAPAPVPNFDSPPRDPDGDGRYEDVTGDGATTLADVQALVANGQGPAPDRGETAFDYNGDGTVTVADLQRLFAERTAGSSGGAASPRRHGTGSR